MGPLGASHCSEDSQAGQYPESWEVSTASSDRLQGKSSYLLWERPQEELI
ncbi:hypothetical protein NC651_035121 [Populus alba x Populus x berolinensis]|nr:hypothetical protein NC651_035121 [Populus alba x Populus x berolinensis]